MANTRDIRRRIRSVKSTQQITKAMKMVSAAKLRRAQSGVVAARPYTQKLAEVMEHLSTTVTHPYTERREVKKTGFVVLAGNRGLCGGFNTNVFHAAEAAAREAGDYALIVVGNRTRDYFRSRRAEIALQFENVSDNPSFYQGKELAKAISKLYLDGVFDEIYLVYTEFRSALSATPVVKKLLPVMTAAVEDDGYEPFAEHIYEPGEKEIIEVILPQYLDVTVYTALLEAKASEHGARMAAMSSATDNASEIIRSLTLSLNRARQAAITTEISEIVGGAAALE